MSQFAPLLIVMATEADTDALGRLLADHLHPGDTLLLDGPIGAGKSHLARAFIRNRLGRMEDVPSPSFTLVQTYEHPAGDIWHADLYRLSHPDEVLELGLEDAFASAICLVEWPDRLGRLAPANAIHLTLSLQGDGRLAELRFSGRDALRTALAQFCPPDDCQADD
ncbi:MAG: tRNA (adenosine(37)-N6)-threonylcarbamoyltransferase complex ATPase subunit type 1 TsaE [Rhodobacteraceae bacterium]|nr:tRNA (adenosine(37)-N6)-threonylcarbamoyltransferase complex ATPase subunit type 1 TsaE [Paracoccaceae bacterium]